MARHKTAVDACLSETMVFIWIDLRKSNFHEFTTTSRAILSVCRVEAQGGKGLLIRSTGAARQYVSYLRPFGVHAWANTHIAPVAASVRFSNNSTTIAGRTTDRSRSFTYRAHVVKNYESAYSARAIACETLHCCGSMTLRTFHVGQTLVVDYQRNCAGLEAPKPVHSLADPPRNLAS